jgi:hypothetical protein
MKYFVLFLTLLGIQSGYAQGSLLPLHSPSEQILERWDILFPEHWIIMPRFGATPGKM